MTLSDLASLGSFISGVAVLVTLVFLLLQLRQSDRNQRSLMQQGRSARQVGTRAGMMDPAMSAIIVRAERLDPSLTAEEIQAYFSMCDSWMVNYADSFIQHRAGTADRAMWAHDQHAMRTLASVPSFRIAWQYMRMFHSGDFRAFFDGLVQEAAPVALPDYREVWEAGITAHAAKAP
ncbi:MAG: hypothetical protein JO348_04740 [Alphaproteobacteria bacterium]|nr:hypothetical protein [Alphaproteobacteria bacterium]MBV9419060.1 hypothetical protein [Alphaproteobacteria bacterium]